MPYVSDGSSWHIEANTPWATAAAAWSALTTGGYPALILHGNAGTSATYTISGNRLNFTVAITTGAGAVSGGTLGTFTLTGRNQAPTALVSPADAVSAATFPYVQATSTSLALKVAGELEPGTTYTYAIAVVGA